MSRPVLPYGFEAKRFTNSDERLVGRWTVVSEVDWYQVRLDLNVLGISSDEWLSLLLKGYTWIDRDEPPILLGMWPVVGQRNGNLFVGLSSERHFAGGDPIEGPGRRVA